MIAYKVYMLYDGMSCGEKLCYNSKKRKLEIKESAYSDISKYTAIFRSIIKAKKKLLKFKEENDYEFESGITFKIKKIIIH